MPIDIGGVSLRRPGDVEVQQGGGHGGAGGGPGHHAGHHQVRQRLHAPDSNHRL